MVDLMPSGFRGVDRRDSISSLSTVSSPPAPPSEAEVLRASVKAASIAARYLNVFSEQSPGGGPCTALRGYLAFAQGFVHSAPRWEREELRRFLECICATPPPKRTRGAAPAAVPVPGDWVLDCFVAERYYERSGFGRAVYRMLRGRAEELGYVVMERRHSQGPGDSKGSGAGRSQRCGSKGNRSSPPPASTTSVPLLIRLAPAGWEALRGHLAVPTTAEAPGDILFTILQGDGAPAPARDSFASARTSTEGLVLPPEDDSERFESLGSFDTRTSLFSQQSFFDFGDDLKERSSGSSSTTMSHLPLGKRMSPLAAQKAQRRSSWAAPFGDLAEATRESPNFLERNSSPWLERIDSPLDLLESPGHDGVRPLGALLGAASPLDLASPGGSASSLPYGE